MHAQRDGNVSTVLEIWESKKFDSYMHIKEFIFSVYIFLFIIIRIKWGALSRYSIAILLKEPFYPA